ncbi:MAG TPA: membrane protein insertion efficiency factor YidD [Desulfitobacteriaceae bacterium]|nr:membrane protein insertion efficiency factor YidD [Desulfitobacteriaceae bacterium]
MIIKGIIAFIHFYQKYISPFKKPSCRFYPTCSEYTVQALVKYGLFKGVGKSIIRILKCQPFHPGGHDPI